MSIIFYTTLPSLEQYVQPKSVSEAVSLLAEYREEAKILAGGTDLVPLMRSRVVTPRCLVDIGRIPGLNYISRDGGGYLTVGALATIRALELSPAIKENYYLLYEAALGMATTQVKNMGTVVGNICRASPSADTAPPLLALEAELMISGPTQSKRVALTDFFLGPGQTILKPDEMVTEIRLPKLPAATGTAFLRLVRVTADLAKVNVAAVLTLSHGLCEDARIALGAVAPTPIRARSAERTLKGHKPESTLFDRAAEIAAGEIKPITDLRSSAEYRTEISKVLVKRALTLALERAKAATRR